MSTTVTADRAREACAAEVRATLARKRISGVRLAAMIDRSQVYVSRRLRGEVPFDVVDLALIADALGVKQSSLLSRGDIETYLAGAHKPPVRPTGTPTLRAHSRPSDGRPIGRSAAVTRPPGSFRTSRID